jgi:uncharacterized protein (TIGR02145 family)
MKTKFFRMTVLLLWPVVCVAQNGVTVSGLKVDSGTVTFTVSWKTPMPVDVWSDSVWVFVDYNKNGRMERLPLLSGATLTATSAPGVGKVIEVESNNQGVWIAGNARSAAGSFSATVQLLTAVKDVGGACVYGSNYPPVGEYTATDKIEFTGTPMYEILLTKSGGETATVKSGDTFLLPCDYTVTSFTDRTGAPGIIASTPADTPPYAASTKTWIITSGTITQIWSDRINVPACTNASFTSDVSQPKCCSDLYKDVLSYYYNWSYVNTYGSTVLCPSPWRVPSRSDFVQLNTALGGVGEQWSGATDALLQRYIDLWGATYTGYNPYSYDFRDIAYYWTSDVLGNNQAYMPHIAPALHRLSVNYTTSVASGVKVRCVR